MVSCAWNISAHCIPVYGNCDICVIKLFHLLFSTPFQLNRRFDFKFPFSFASGFWNLSTCMSLLMCDVFFWIFINWNTLIFYLSYSSLYYIFACHFCYMWYLVHAWLSSRLFFPFLPLCLSCLHKYGKTLLYPMWNWLNTNNLYTFSFLINNFTRFWTSKCILASFVWFLQINLEFVMIEQTTKYTSNWNENL